MKFVFFMIAFAACLSIPGIANAQSIDPADSLKKIKNCVEIQNDTDRLACYDESVGRFSQELESGDIMIVDKVSVDEAKKEGFGLNLPSLSGLGKIFKSDGTPDLPDNTDRIQIDIKSVEKFGYKKNRFFLENGQIWDQVESSNFRAPKRKDKEPYFAIISKASLGSFYLRINDKGKKIKVRRVK